MSRRDISYWMLALAGLVQEGGVFGEWPLTVHYFTFCTSVVLPQCRRPAWLVWMLFLHRALCPG